jgi:glycosyltransferase involved in cell wall biosynthesis
MPMIATRVGGIPEIFGREAGRLVASGDAGALADAMARHLASPDEARAEAATLRDLVRPVFSIEAMTAAVEAAYRRALEPA